MTPLNSSFRWLVHNCFHSPCRISTQCTHSLMDKVMSDHCSVCLNQRESKLVRLLLPADEEETKGTFAGNKRVTMHIPPVLTNNKPLNPQGHCFWVGLGSATHSCLPARIWLALPCHLHQLLTLQGSLELPLSRSARGNITQPAPPRHVPEAAWQTDSCPGMEPKGHSSQCRAAKPDFLRLSE